MSDERDARAARRPRRAPAIVTTAAAAARAYARDGLFVTGPLLSAAELDELRAAAEVPFNEVLRALLIKQAMSAARGEEASEPVKYAEIMGRDGARFDVRRGFDAAPLKSFLRKGGHADTLRSLLCAVLGDDAEVVQVGQIVALTEEGWADADVEDACGGHGDQHWHTDGRNALAPGTIDESPPGALTLFVSLVDTTLENGATQFVLGSHRQGVDDEAREARALTLPLRAGSAVAFDYRLLHRGMANHGSADRTLIYAIVGRPIWSEDGCFKGLPQLDSGRSTLPSLFGGKATAAPPSFRLDGRRDGAEAPKAHAKAELPSPRRQTSSRKRARTSQQ